MHHGILPRFAKVGQNQEKGESEGVTDKSNHFSLKCFKNLTESLLLRSVLEKLAKVLS